MSASLLRRTLLTAILANLIALASAHLGSSLFAYDNATDVIVDGGYIRVIP